MAAGGSVMVVDDYPDIAEIVKIHLERHHCNALIFNDPFKALDYFKQDPYQFDAIISDIRMPGMSGIELVSLVKNVNQQVKVFLMTAYDIDIVQPEIDSLDIEIVKIFKKTNSFAEITEKIISHIR